MTKFIWQKGMDEKFGPAWTDTYGFPECLDEWQVIHWAWEVQE